MNCSLTRTVDRLASAHLDPSLVSPGAMARVRRLTDALPAALADDIYFECRLAGGRGQVDVVVQVTARGRAILAGADPAIRLAPELASAPVWQRVRALCAAWGDGASPLARVMDGAWLEFDLDRDAEDGGSPVLVPGVFVCLRKLGTPGDPAVLAAATAASMAPLRDAPLPPRTAEMVRRCFEALPRPAYVTHVGCFPGRGGDAVRLCFDDLPDEALPAFLSSVAWPGDLDALSRALARFAAAGAAGERPSCSYLHLDVGASVLPRLCREYRFDRRTQLQRGFRERGFVDALVEMGLCAAEKRDGLLRWPGHELARLDHELWQSRCARRLNHVKLVFDGTGAAEAKGYLAVKHQFRPATLPVRAASHGASAAAV
jgi:hypothetical protein